MVAGDRVTGTVRSEQTTTSGRTLRECEQRIAELEAENEQLMRELARRRQERQAIIDHYERVIRTERTSQQKTSGATGIVAQVGSLL